MNLRLQLDMMAKQAMKLVNQVTPSSSLYARLCTADLALADISGTALLLLL